MSEIENRVQKSGLITLDLQKMIPATDNLMSIDLAEYLYQGLILREKDYRQALKDTDWDAYRDHIVLVHCSADAIIPDWAYMLIASYLTEVASAMYMGTQEEYLTDQLIEAIRSLDAVEYRDARVIIKGCGSELVGAEAYFEISKKLMPLVRSLMYGEPCSTVPIYKAKRS